MRGSSGPDDLLRDRPHSPWTSPTGVDPGSRPGGVRLRSPGSRHLEEIPLVVRRRDGELLAVGAPGDAVGHRVGRDLLVEERLAAVDVPDVEVAAVADRGEPLAVGAPGDGIDVVGVAVELGEFLARRRRSRSGSSCRPSPRRACVPSGRNATQ